MSDAKLNNLQTWSADGYARNARYVADLGQAVLSLLDPQAHERILDIGCGDGALTEKILACGARVVGLDSSPELLKAAGALGLEVRLADAQALEFDREFDAVFSNAALHWMRQPDRVVKGVARALKDGGRFVGEFGGHGNVAAICTAVRAALAKFGVDGGAQRTPWFFPTPAQYAELLSSNGFEVKEISLIPRPTPLPTGMRGWLQTFADPFLVDTDLGSAERGQVLAFAEELLKPSLCDESGNWTADYVRLRFAAVSRGGA